MRWVTSQFFTPEGASSNKSKSVVSATVFLACLIFAGCGTTPEKEASTRQTEAQKIQDQYAGYSTSQLQLKRQEIASSIPSSYWGYGIAGMIQQGQIEGKKKEVAEIDRELLRRVESGDTTARNKVSFLVVSDPPGARIEIDGKFSGTAPRVMEGAVDVATSATIRATPASLDFPMLGFLTGYKNVNGTMTADLSSVGVLSFVAPNSPASKMGLINGDKLLAINGVVLPKITDSKESLDGWQTAFRRELSRVGFGRDVTVKVLRNGSEQELRGRTYEQVEGVYYVQEKVIQPLLFKNQVLLLDTRLKTSTPIVLGVPGNREQPAKGTTSTGTGFVVGEGGYILTCHHVVERAEEIEIRDVAGVKHKARVVASDAENDLCLLQAEKMDAKSIPAAPPNSVSAGETVYCLGYPMAGVLENQNPVAGSGVVASLRGLKGDPRHLQITVPINPGNSGGPILDVYGRWVAVASHKLSDFYGLATSGQTPQGVNFAVKGTLVVPLFDSIPEVKLPIGEGKEKIALEDATKRLSGAVVFITARH